MSPQLVASVLIVAVAACLLALTTALQSALIYLNRSRAHVYASRHGVDWEPLHRTIEERNNLLATLEVARTLAGVFAVSLVLYAVLSATGLRLRAVLITATLTAAVAILLQAIPRAFVRQNPERWGVVLTPAAALYRYTFGWLGWLLDLPARGLVRLLRLPPSPPTEEPQEILRLVELEESSGGIEEEERQMIRGVIGLEDTTAREIMVPRLDIAGVSTSETVEDAARVIVARGFSRLPLYESSIDNIVGIIYAKDLLRCLSANEAATPLTELKRQAHFIPETKRVDELLRELRHNKVHIAIVVDEYGGTAGLVTIEDLIEEIVGEIEDEYDRGELTVERVGPDEAIIDGRASIDVLQDLFNVDVEDSDVDTVGGFVYDNLGKIPLAGDQVTAGDLTITVLSVVGHRIKKVRIVRAAGQPSPLANSSG